MPTRFPYLSVLYWIIPLVGTGLVWDALPRSATQVSLAAAAVIVGLAATLRQVNYPIIGTPFFVLLIGSYYQSFLLVNPLLISAVIMIVLPLVNVLLYRLADQKVTRNEVIEFVVVGFLTAQVNSFLLFWPFSFFENALVSFVAYYTLWQLIHILNHAGTKSLIAHFVFTCLAVILVLGVLTWANFPQFRTF